MQVYQKELQKFDWINIQIRNVIIFCLPKLLLFASLLVSIWYYKYYMGAKSTRPVTLESKDKKYELELIKREDVSHDTRLFRFALREI